MPQRFGSFDFTIQMYGAVIMMGGAAAMSTKTHVKADMYYNKLIRKRAGNIRLNFIYLFLWLQEFLLLTYAGYFYAKKAWAVHEASWNSPAQIQVYFSKSLIPMCWNTFINYRNCRNF
jgi:TRAP-type mannitol/chloroaromatic compound transport system permease small subunit